MKKKSKSQNFDKPAGEQQKLEQKQTTRIRDEDEEEVKQIE